MKILTFTTLYPNASRPSHGIFVETRLRHLLENGGVASKVVAPVPWFPSDNPIYGRYAAFASTPRVEKRHGIDVLHPRYLSVPKFGMNVSPLLLAARVGPLLDTMVRGDFGFDIIDAHYFYPDGVAAAIIGRRLNKPVVITARGTDINLFPKFAVPRRMIVWAAKQAAALVTVSAALKEVLVQLGVDAGKITVLRNGVDTRIFRPVDRIMHRARLGLKGTVLLMVGNLVSLKGHELVLQALIEFPDACLLIVGDGEERRNLETLTSELQLQHRVRFLGAIPQEQLATFYGAADALVLASSREGWPNVLLEAMACGTPVVSVSVGGTPEIVATTEAGVLMAERSARGVAEALRHLLQNYPDRDLTKNYAKRFSWDDTTNGQLAMFEDILRRKA
jgi:glycosyltransferase involved in cell wall biosynthesis